jgi:Novel STAND NTPase 1
MVISEKTQKQLELVAGIIGAFGGIVIALGGIVGNFTDFFGKIEAFSKLPSWVFLTASGVLFVLGLWLLIRWRTRHSSLRNPDALRLDRNNAEHLVGRAEDIDNLLQQCLVKQIVFLEGESGSGKSALVRSGLLPRLKDDKSIVPLMLADLWVNQWERGPSQTLKRAIIAALSRPMRRSRLPTARQNPHLPKSSRSSPGSATSKGAQR